MVECVSDVNIYVNMNVLDDFNTAIYFTLHNNNMDA